MKQAILELLYVKIIKHEYLSSKYLQESDRKTGLIDFKKMSDIEKGIAVAFKELREEIEKMEENTKEVCTACSGSGVYDNEGTPPCDGCDGRGYNYLYE